MKTNTSFYRLSCFVLMLFVSACQSAAPTVQPAFTLEPTVTQSVQDIPTVTPIPTNTPNLVDTCKLQPVAFTNVGLGLPKPEYKLPSLGVVKTIVLFADFSDAPASQKPEEVLALFSPNAEKFYADISYGRMEYVLEPHFVWLRLEHPSEYYGQGIGTYDGHLQFIQEAVTLADTDVDFSVADSVLVVVPPQASNVAYGPAFGANQGAGYSADGKTFENGVTSGPDLLNWGYLWLNHETGHIMSLPDLYAYQADPSNYDDIHRFVGGFGLMGFIGGNAPEFFAFERWQLGWLDDNQIMCQQADDGTTSLTAIETTGGIKAVIVPISPTKALVVESRRAIGYDEKLLKEGALVYTVDTSVYSGEGPIIVYPILDNDPYRNQSPLAVGESVTVENVTITVLEATDQGDMVQVTVSR